MNIRANLLVAGLLATPVTGYSYQFVPNDTEWATWPEFCKARYVTLPLGRSEGFGDRLPVVTVQHWHTQLAEAFIHVHHYCAGKVYAGRAQRAVNEREQQRWWDRAVGEARYTFLRTERTNPLFGEILAFIANGEYHLGNRSEAKNMLQGFISESSTSDRPFVLYAMLLQKEDSLDEALSVLELARSLGITSSAEVEYLMGLTLFKKQRFEEAHAAAKRAYGLGYPLPALRDKLIDKGYAF